MIWWEVCQTCGKGFRGDQRFTVEADLRAHIAEHHPTDSGDDRE